MVLNKINKNKTLGGSKNRLFTFVFIFCKYALGQIYLHITSVFSYMKYKIFLYENKKFLNKI